MSEKVLPDIQLGGTVESLKTPPNSKRMLKWVRYWTRERVFLSLFASGFLLVLSNDVVHDRLTFEKFLAHTITFLLGKQVAAASRVPVGHAPDSGEATTGSLASPGKQRTTRATGERDKGKAKRGALRKGSTKKTTPPFQNSG
jgi:hypothetical protein